MGYNYNYEGDFSNIVTIEENKKRAIINALCMTVTIKHASLELDKSERFLFDFMDANGISYEHVSIMRKRFVLSEKKVKLRFKATYDGKKYHYSKNSESQERLAMVQKQNQSDIQSQGNKR